jgi:hypothetical protein
VPPPFLQFCLGFFILIKARYNQIIFVGEQDAARERPAFEAALVKHTAPRFSCSYPPDPFPRPRSGAPVNRNQETWTGKLANGREITQADLKRIVQAHALWLESEGKKGKRADLSYANLTEADMRQANLSKAILDLPN